MLGAQLRAWLGPVLDSSATQLELLPNQRATEDTLLALQKPCQLGWVGWWLPVIMDAPAGHVLSCCRLTSLSGCLIAVALPRVPWVNGGGVTCPVGG